jgi:hypothetical protein
VLAPPPGWPPRPARPRRPGARRFLSAKPLPPSIPPNSYLGLKPILKPDPDAVAALVRGPGRRAGLGGGPGAGRLSPRLAARRLQPPSHCPALSAPPPPGLNPLLPLLPACSLPAPPPPPLQLSWLCIVAGNYVFVLPRTGGGAPAWHVIGQGALFGLLLYGTVDLTNCALLSGWGWTVAGVDMVWGALASSVLALTQRTLAGVSPSAGLM